nr:unnamed protein product [Haemonchus contortus]
MEGVTVEVNHVKLRHSQLDLVSKQKSHRADLYRHGAAEGGANDRPTSVHYQRRQMMDRAAWVGVMSERAAYEDKLRVGYPQKKKFAQFGFSYEDRVVGFVMHPIIRVHGHIDPN